MKKYKESISKLHVPEELERKILDMTVNKKKVKKNTWLKYSLVPMCLLIMVSCFMLFSDKNSPKIFTTESGNEIVINNLKNVGAALLDVKIDENVNFDEFAFINNIKIPNDLLLSTRYLMYTKELCETKEECAIAPYDIAHTYTLWYEKMINNIVQSKIIISFSREFAPLRDYFIENNNFKTSTINNTELTIANYNEMYIATFSYNGLNFDIESNGISETELIELLESIIK